MASDHESGLRDQADGLRRLMTSPLAALCTVLSADDRAHKPALVNRLAASMARRGHPVMLIDTAATAGSDCEGRPSLLDVVRQKASLDEVRMLGADGIARCRLDLVPGAHAGRDTDIHELASLLRGLAADGMRVLVNAELDAQGQLPLAMLADGDIVVQLSGSADAIRDAYAMLRQLKSLCGRGTVSLLVTEADPVRARHVHANLFHAASRYLALPVRSITAPPSLLPSGRTRSVAAIAAVNVPATDPTLRGNRHV